MFRNLIRTTSLASLLTVTLLQGAIAADPATVPARKVAGKITFSLPYMGYVTEFLKTPWGFATGMVLPAIIIIAMYVWSVWQTLARRQRVRDKDE